MENKHRSCPSHCCVEHGCKYGYKDCPVVIGKVRQKYFCEDCIYENVRDGEIDTLFKKRNRLWKISIMEK